MLFSKPNTSSSVVYSLHSKMVTQIVPFVLLVLAQATPNASWRLLTKTGFNESSYSVRHLSMHYSRVFLSISVKGNDSPTLIETQWQVSHFPMTTVIFPHRNIHANGAHSDCTLLQQAHWSQVDGLSRLWVMDIGWPDSRCPPRLFVFDLIRNNAELLRIDCGQHIDFNDTQSLVVRFGPKAKSSKLERHIYFILGHGPHILTYDILEQTWKSRSLKSHKYESMQQSFPIKPIDFTFGLQGELIVADKDGGIYRSLDSLQWEDSSELSSSSLKSHIQLTPLGTLLGNGRSMIMDSLGTLYYVIPKFGAVVRCVQLVNITAEGNEIIYMTSKNLQQIFFGNNGAVWVLSDRVLKTQQMCFPGMPYNDVF
ncbi:uncharacterized protein LOC117895122 [Drosophila subobscura]|uniref:uncharacterized protein LOC117895122 n=1 Tax=Drosophila subobscura TaxID=7241 RepID=UPI00155A9252|nr:uncharacterized protein LOC117895122 [Drosophila subobscura]